MINSPVLDTAIGLIFIFLLYSLLTTSINEAIATLFSLRARTLKRGIIDGMLSNSNHKEWIWKGSLKAAAIFFKDLFFLIIGYKPNENSKLGEKFYNHPIIKNYGSNDRFSIPSYIPKENFSTILIEILEEYWDNHKEDISKYIKENNITNNVDLENTPRITKINYLIKYLQNPASKKLNEVPENNEIPTQNTESENLTEVFKNIKTFLQSIGIRKSSKELENKKMYIDEEILQILALYLSKSYENIETFTSQLETWYDDSMNRVSGWYKRQIQFILFFIGLTIAITFNVDIIDIAGKLSTDKDARDKLVELSIKSAEELKTDRRVQQTQDTTVNDTVNKDYKSEVQNIKKELNGRVKEANNLLAIGWGDYGLKKDSVATVRDYVCELEKLHNTVKEQLSIPPSKIKDSTAIYNHAAMLALYDKHWFKFKVGYVATNFYKGRKPLGFLLLAFGICLGAPFWFDLLQKLIKIRAAGKKEETDTGNTPTTPSSQPVQVTINSNTNPEAIG